LNFSVVDLGNSFSLGTGIPVMDLPRSGTRGYNEINEDFFSLGSETSMVETDFSKLGLRSNFDVL
jgi:hypothetical protein